MNFAAIVSSRLMRLSALGISTGSLLLLGGCGLGSVATGGGGSVSPLVVTGNVHGGQQPVSHSVVTLYSSGSTGYGAGATALAHSTTENGSGNFSFVKGSGGSSNNTDNTWHCPTDGTDPLIYLIAKGGNPNGTSDTTGDNPAIAMTTVLGRCSQVSTSTFAVINEVSTSAVAAAFGPFFNPGTEQIGSNGSIKLSGTSSQSGVALTNAFLSLNNLLNIAGGQPVTSNSYAGSGTAAGVTVTATPESAKLATMANILSACVNTTATGGTAGTCAQLFAGATPPQYPNQTSMPSATYATATDTLQAALYMSTNPVNAGTFTPCGTGPTTNAQCLYALVSAFAAFPGSVAAAPLDWTLGVTYASTDSCPSGGLFLNAPNKEAIDASGNIWFIGFNNTANTNLAEISPQGQPLFCYGTAATKSGRGVTIDPTGNVWASFNVTGTGVVEVPAGNSTPVTYTLATAPYGIAADGFGNIFYSQIGTGGAIYELVSPGTSTAGSSSLASWINVGSNVTGTSASTSLLNVAPDLTGKVWVSGTSNSTMGGIVPNAPITVGGVTISGGTATFLGGNSFAVGNQVAVYGFTNPSTTALNYKVLTITAATPITFSAAVSLPDSSAIVDNATAFLTGAASGYTAASFNLTTAANYGLAVDGSGYIYSGATCCGSGTPYRVFNKTTYSGGTFSKSASAAYLAGINGARSLALDGAGNAWAGFEFPSTTDGLFSIGEFFTTGSGTTATFTALSPSGTNVSCVSGGPCTTNGGFIKAGIGQMRDIAVDPAGSVWAVNYGSDAASNGNSITQIVGAGVPVITPIALGASQGKLASKP